MSNCREQNVELFVSKMCQWANDKSSVSNKNAKKLAPAIRRILYEVLPSKSQDYHLVVSELVNSDSLVLKSISERYIVVPTDKKKVKIGVFTPDWSQGLGKYLRQKEVCDVVSGFFHFAEQYVRRSILVELMGAISLTYDRPTSFYSDSLQRLSIAPSALTRDQAISNAFSKELTRNFKVTSSKQKRFFEVLRLINGLDPFIHRMIFNFIRAQELREHSFAEEAITALDKAVNVAEQFLKERLLVTGENSREELANYIGLNKNEIDALEHIYQLRCYFGGHPAMSKWWDFAELYPETEEDYFYLVNKVILKFIQIENSRRLVMKEPESWVEWFKENWTVVWDVAWFEKLPE